MGHLQERIRSTGDGTLNALLWVKYMWMENNNFLLKYLFDSGTVGVCPSEISI